VSQPASAGKRSLSLLLKPLRVLTERSAAAIGDAYARTAHKLLTHRERLEDEAAERRHRRRTRHEAERVAKGGIAVAKSDLS
jgi:hypothetical protein